MGLHQWRIQGGSQDNRTPKRLIKVHTFFVAIKVETEVQNTLNYVSHFVELHDLRADFHPNFLKSSGIAYHVFTACTHRLITMGVDCCCRHHPWLHLSFQGIMLHATVAVVQVHHSKMKCTMAYVYGKVFAGGRAGKKLP